MSTPTAHTKGKFRIPDAAFGYLSYLIPLVGLYLFASLSLRFTGEAIGGVFLFLAIYFYWGWTPISNMEYLVIERFGEFSRIVHSGSRFLTLPGLIDKIVARGTLGEQSLILFAAENGKPHVIDFKDGSSPVDATASFSVGPRDAETGSIDNAIYKYTYAIRNENERRKRISMILESATSPQLQALKIDEALQQKDTVAEGVTAEKKTRDALETIGIELNPQKGLIISDIELPPEIVEQRQKTLQGASDAIKQQALGLGYARSIQAIMNELNVDQERAIEIFQTQRGLEVLGTLDANVSFVAPDMKGIQVAMGVGSGKGPKSHQPKVEKEITS